MKDEAIQFVKQAIQPATDFLQSPEAPLYIAGAIAIALLGVAAIWFTRKNMKFSVSDPTRMIHSLSRGKDIQSRAPIILPKK